MESSSSQQRRYMINGSKELSASSMAFTPQQPNPNPNTSTNPRDVYLREENERQSPPRVSQQTNQRNSEYPVKTIVLSNVGEQRNVLQKYKYINQLARMEYQDKEEEVYSRYTRISKQTVLKKIKARNQIAEFEEEDEQENEWFDELMDFKFGKNRNSNFHFQKDS